jgi:hypothetical protein
VMRVMLPPHGAPGQSASLSSKVRHSAIRRDGCRPSFSFI